MDILFSIYVLNPLINSINAFPNNNAFCINEIFYTYKEFGKHVSKIRDRINKLEEGVNYIGLVANDDIQTYASIFALWLESKAYLPLHPEQPYERNIEVLGQMGIVTILDSSDVTKYTSSHVVNTQDLCFKNYFLELNDNINDNNLAYILFTSGSTGKPKGVMINGKNVGAFMESFWNTGIEINENDKCLQIFDLTFDVSIQSFLVPLTKGACVYTIPHNQIKYSYVFGLLEDHKITFGAMAPSMLRYLKPYFNEIYLPEMKTCIVTAEASPLNLVSEWQKCIPNATIYDFYGPTEATIYCTYYKVKRNNQNKTLNGMLSIGKPLKNVEAIIVDENNEILSRGQKGELCVAGDQITQGYWNNPKKNTEVFFEKEYKGILQRFYHTGDLCFIEEKGNLMLYGRLDSQVKVQGYRVELGEIEFHARKHLEGINTVVIPFLNKSNNTELVIFIEGDKVNKISLENYLKSKLPSYMIPARMVLVPLFPLNSNDKVDKIKLKQKLE